MNFTRQTLTYAVTPSMFGDTTFTEAVQARFPRSKKRRIRRKWAKDLRNYEQRPLTAVKLLSLLMLAKDKMRRALEAKLADKLGWGTRLPEIVFDIEPTPEDQPISIRARFDVLPPKIPRFIFADV